MTNINPRVLCVDDEIEVLEGIKQNLRRHFNLHLATSAEQALDKMKDKTFAVIVSDMRMPGMNGATFLQKSRELSPDTIRILLTGECDLQSAISAVNEGQIFQFLSKPCSSKDLQNVISAAVKQYQLVTAERELLQKTLKGSIKLLTDALAITSPLAFGRAKRLHKKVSTVVKILKIRDGWHLEIASMLSQLGAISLQDETLEKLYFGAELNDDERESVAKIPITTRQLLDNIPRLERVVKLLDELHSDKAKTKSSLSTAAQILGFAIELEELETRGTSVETAIDTIGSRKNTYSLEVLEAFSSGCSEKGHRDNIQEIPAMALQEGMIVAQDIYTSAGALLVTRGFEVTQSFAIKVRSFKKQYLKEPLRVIIPEVHHEG